MSDFLFVYGTLQEELDNSMSKFLSQNSKRIGKAFVYGKMYAISWFPGVVLSNINTEKVFGTLFQLKSPNKVFKVLDDFEGVFLDKPENSLFKRVNTQIFLENGDKVESWIYIYNQSINNKKRIISGDFLKDGNT